MAPFPHPAHRTGQADFPHPALGQDFTLSRATPSAASEPFSELIGFPISRSFTTYCACLELRSLPSTGVTRLPRYYEPLRHPRAPSLSLTGLWLVIADHASVVGVILNLSVWFALHTLFRETTPVRSFGLSFDLPVISSVDLAALVLAIAAA